MKLQEHTDLRTDTEMGKLLGYRKSVLERKRAIKAYRRRVKKEYHRYCRLFGLDEIRELTIALDTAFVDTKSLKNRIKTDVLKLSGALDLSGIEVLDLCGQKEFGQLQKAMASLDTAVREDDRMTQEHFSISLS